MMTCSKQQTNRQSKHAKHLKKAHTHTHTHPGPVIPMTEKLILLSYPGRQLVYRVSTGTGWPGVSILWLDEIASLTCRFCFSVTARIIVWVDPSLRNTGMLLWLTLSSLRTTTTSGAGITEADDRQVTTVFTVLPSFHHRHSTNRVGERGVTPHLVVRRRWKRFMIGLSSAEGGMAVGLWKLSSFDGRRPPWCRLLVLVVVALLVLLSLEQSRAKITVIHLWRDRGFQNKVQKKI